MTPTERKLRELADRIAALEAGLAEVTTCFEDATDLIDDERDILGVEYGDIRESRAVIAKARTLLTPSQAGEQTFRDFAAKVPEFPTSLLATSEPRTTGLTFTEALATGRPMRRKPGAGDFGMWLVIGRDGSHRHPPRGPRGSWVDARSLDIDDYLATDWEVQPERTEGGDRG